MQSIVPSQSELNTSFNLDKSSKISSIAWVPLGEQVLAISLTRGATLLFSPASNTIIAELNLNLNLAIQDFHYSSLTHTAFSCDIGGNVIEWDLTTFSQISQFKINEFLEDVESIFKLSTVVYNDIPHLLLASHSIYLVDISSKSVIKTFPGHIQPISSLIPIDEDLFLTSAIGDRFMNLNSIKKSSNTAVFVAQTPIKSVSLLNKNGKSILTALTENGTMEIFNDPFNLNENNSISTSSKKKRRQQASLVQSHSSNSIYKLSRPEIEIKSVQDANLIINSSSINDNHIIISWLENSSVSYFESIKWLDESGNYLIDSNLIIYKSRPNLKSTQSLTERGHDIAASKPYVEGHAIISDGNNIRDLEEDEDEESLAEKLDKISTEQISKKKSKKIDGKNTTKSLAIILSQSLRNNDHSLLETVLSNRDSQVIQNTISKLDSSLAIVLLDRLSEKIQRQASRFNQLNSWLKWILIIHGAVLASLPKLNTKFSNLHSVLIKKSDTLPRLLELQGRLTLLYHQTELKREIVSNEVDDVVEDIDSDIEYVEELDDAQLLNGDLSDIEIGDHDDYEESDAEMIEIENIDEDDDDEDEELEQENYSDLEIEDNETK